MTSPTTTPADRPPRLASPATALALALAATTALLLVVIAGATLGGSWTVDPLPLPSISVAPPEALTPPPPPEDPPPTAQPETGIDALAPVATILALVLLVLLVLLGRWAYRALRPWLTEHRDPALDTGPPPALDIVPLTPLAEATAHAQTLLRQDAEPTDAIIAAWLALEEAAVHSGATRAPAQTPTEFTLTVLSATPASPQAVTDLLDLYHLARFAHTDITPDQVATAGRALRQLTADFRHREPAAEQTR